MSFVSDAAAEEDRVSEEKEKEEAQDTAVSGIVQIPYNGDKSPTEATAATTTTTKEKRRSSSSPSPPPPPESDIESFDTIEIKTEPLSPSYPNFTNGGYGKDEDDGQHENIQDDSITFDEQIVKEEPPSPPCEAAESTFFPHYNQKILRICISRLNIPSKCFIVKRKVVDLRVLKRCKPDLCIKLEKRKVSRSRSNSNASHHKRSERKSKVVPGGQGESKANKKGKKKKKDVEQKLSESSDLDSDLEEIRRRIKKPAGLKVKEVSTPIKLSAEKKKKKTSSSYKTSSSQVKKKIISDNKPPKIKQCCIVKLHRLSENDIKKYLSRSHSRSRSSSKARQKPSTKAKIETTVKTESLEEKKVESKHVINDSSSDEEEKRAKEKENSKRLVLNPLFKLLGSSPPVKRNTSPSNENMGEVKEKLVEKLFNLISSDDKEQPPPPPPPKKDEVEVKDEEEKSENKENKILSDNDNDNLVLSDIADLEESLANEYGNESDTDVAVTKDITNPKPDDKANTTPLEEISVPTRKKLSTTEFDTSIFDTSSELSSFRDDLKNELRGGDLSFLNLPKINLREFEEVVTKAIYNLEEEGVQKEEVSKKRRYKKYDKPLPLAERIKEIYKLKECKVIIPDIGKSEKYSKTYKKALCNYKNRRKQDLLKGLDMVKKKSQDQNYSEWKRNHHSESSSSSKFDRFKKHKQRSFQHNNLQLDTDYADDLSQLSSFKIPKKDKTNAEIDMKSILKAGVAKATPPPNAIKKSAYSRCRPKPMRHRERKPVINPDTFEPSPEAAKLDVMNIVYDMQSTLKKDKKKEFSDHKAREEERKLEARKKFEPQFQRQIDNSDNVPKLDDLLKIKLMDSLSRVFHPFSTWEDFRGPHFKCRICNAFTGTLKDLLRHIGGKRHKEHMLNYKDVTDNSEEAKKTRILDQIKREKELLERTKKSASVKSNSSFQKSFLRRPSSPEGDRQRTPPINDDFCNDDYLENISDDDDDNVSGIGNKLTISSSISLPLPVPSVPKIPTPVPTTVPTTLPTPVSTPVRPIAMIDNAMPKKPIEQKLSQSALDCLPKEMSFSERVNRLKSSVDNDWANKIEKQQRKESTSSSSKTEVHIEGAAGSSRPSSVDGSSGIEFNIDPNKSFINSPEFQAEVKENIEQERQKMLKIRPLETLIKNNEKESSKLLAGEAVSLFLDKVIKALQSWNDPKKSNNKISGIGDSDNEVEKQPPLPNEPPPPLPPPPPPPLPPPPENSGVSPPKDSRDTDVINVIEGDFDDDLILKIVSELDQTLAEEDKLAKAKEKLANILSARQRRKKSIDRDMDQSQFQFPAFSRPPPPLPLPPPPPPLPPSKPKPKITENDISDFMSQWCASETTTTTEDFNSCHESTKSPTSSSSAAAAAAAAAEPEVKEPTFSSALAKLRAKKQKKQQLQNSKKTRNKRKLSDSSPNDQIKKIKNEDGLQSQITSPWIEGIAIPPLSIQTSIPPPPPQFPITNIPLLPQPVPAPSPLPSSSVGGAAAAVLNPDNKTNNFQHNPFVSPITKRPYDLGPRRYMEEWYKILSNGWQKHLDLYQLEIQAKRQSDQHNPEGAQFSGDSRLNTWVRDKDGKTFRVFDSWKENNALFFSCEICKIRVNGFQNLQSHLNGKNHMSRMADFQIAEEPLPPGEESIPGQPLILQMLDQYKDAPIIGVEFIVEILRGKREPVYYCVLCDKNFDSMGVMSELLGPEHRLKYLERYFPTCRNKFAKVMNMTYWQRPTFDFLESVIQKIEQRYGRLKPRVIGSEEKFDSEKQKITKEIDNGKHFRESPDLNFASLPDPFGSYLFKIPNIEISKGDNFVPLGTDDGGLDHIEDPEMQSLLQREIKRFRTTQKGIENPIPVNVGKQGGDDADAQRPRKEENPSEKPVVTISAGPVLINPNQDPEKARVMAKIAAMRQELASDEIVKQGYEKYKNLSSIGDMDDISNDDLPSPDKEGNHQNATEKSSSKPVLHRFKNPVPLDDKKSSTRKSDHKKGDRDNQRRSIDSRGRRRSLSRERWRRDPADRARGGSGSGGGGGRDRPHFGRKSRSPPPFRRKSRSPPPFRRSSRSPYRRRSRSHSPSRRRSRSPTSRRRRKSPSPYSDALERYDKFKMAKRVMMDAVDRKKEIFDKRPEDHPQYPEEWRMFWEKRYKDLQAKGEDADNYDYKSEWIPFWAKRVAKIFEEEIAEKIKGLLRQFDLKSEEKPRARDFVRKPTCPSRRSRSKSRSRGGGSLDDRHRNPEDRRSEPNRRSEERRRQYSDSPSGRTPTLYRGGGGGGGDFETYSRITDLENLRDRGRSISPHQRLSEILDAVEIIPVTRLLLAVEQQLGSLGPQVNNIFAKSLSLEKQRRGMSGILLEDCDVAAVMEMVYEKLGAQLDAGFLDDDNKVVNAVQIAVSSLSRLLQKMTRKRPLNPPNIRFEPEPDEASKLMDLIAEQLSKNLVHQGLEDISDESLVMILNELIKETELDDGIPYVLPQQQQQQYYSIAVTRQQQQQFPAPPPPTSAPSGGVSTTTAATESDDDDVIEIDDNEFDDLTIEELRSLLDNFKNLSRGEQTDLIQYMRKLESSNPEKVRELRQGRQQPTKPQQEQREQEQEQQQSVDDDQSWSPLRLRDITRLQNPSAP